MRKKWFLSIRPPGRLSSHSPRAFGPVVACGILPAALFLGLSPHTLKVLSSYKKTYIKIVTIYHRRWEDIFGVWILNSY